MSKKLVNFIASTVLLMIVGGVTGFVAFLLLKVPLPWFFVIGLVSGWILSTPIKKLAEKFTNYVTKN